MKVIMNLLEAYADHVGLPLLLANINGGIDYKVDGNNRSLPVDESGSYLPEFKKVSLQLNKPTIMSVSDELYTSSIFYIITPVFKVKNIKSFLAAGPFLVESINAKKNAIRNEYFFDVFNDEEIEERLNKMENLHLLLKNKEKVDTRFLIPEQIIDVLQTLNDFDSDLLDFEEYIFSILDKFLNIEAFDFIGLALKNKDDIFVIKHIQGEKVQRLVEKRFYIGEGLLGKAAILGKDFYWSNGIDTQRAEFLNRYGIFPNHLFGFTLKHEEMVNGIIFGGSFKEEVISENLLKLIKFIINVVYEKKNINTKIMDSYYIKSIFANWLDLMDIATYVKDKKHISYKILDFCQTLNNGKFSCFSTTDHNDFIYRGKMQNEVIQIHQNALNNTLDQQKVTLWVDHHYIHFYLDFDFQRYGLFTVEFEEDTDFQQAAYILGMINKLLRQKNDASLNNELLHNESIFQLLHTSMREMNHHQYYLSNLSLKFIKKITESLQVTDDSKEMLLNICKVLPYSVEYLKKHIAHTNEWKLLRETQNIWCNNLKFKEYNIESKILAFICKVIVQGERKESLDFLSIELNELFINAYDASLKLAEQDSKELKEEMDRKRIEEMTDLNSVISTLALTSREKEILYLILEGLNNQEVGNYLKISVHTVKNHVTNIFKKLNVSDRIQAMAKIYRIKYGEG